jgi:uncharacterized protein
MRADLKAAMKARDRVTVAALRSALAAIENAEAPPAPEPVIGDAAIAGAALGVGATEAERRTLTDADLTSILDNEVRERATAAEEYDRLGHTDEATRLRAEADILSRYLS